MRIEAGRRDDDEASTGAGEGGGRDDDEATTSAGGVSRAVRMTTVRTAGGEDRG